MQGKLSNASLIGVLVLAFTLFVAGLTHSTDGEEVIQAGATPTPTRTPTPINVGNFVFSDLDADGVQGPGEPGVVGITVQLWNQAKTTVLASATTSANGNYTVIAPVPGTYVVRFVVPTGYTTTQKDAGANDQLDSDANSDGFTDEYIFPNNLISITTIDAGLLIPAYIPLTPARLVDTRGGAVAQGVTNQVGLRTADSTLTLQVAGLGGVPLGASAATLNITAVDPVGIGFFTVYPCDKPLPTASSLNTSGVNVANELSAPLSAAGTVCIYTSVNTHILADVSGAFVG